MSVLHAPPLSAAQRERQRSGFRPDIEGLRAVAVVLVALNHAGISWLRGGYVGVDVFFVLSGYLITGLLLGEGARRGRVSIARFYARRVRRILPAAALVTVVVMVLAYPLAGPVEGRSVAQDGFWTGLFLGNVHFARSGVDYFNRGSVTSPLQHFWSLGVEEQFYVVWPLLILLVFALVPARRRFSAVAAVIGLIVVASLAWSIHQTHTSPTFAYFSPFTRAYELGIGALLATATVWLPFPGRVLGNVLGALGCGVIVVCAVRFDAGTGFPGWAALVPTLAAAAVIVGGAGEPTLAGRVLGCAPMRFVGLRSYGFYLWHFPFLILPALYAGRTLSTTANLIWLIIAFGVASLSYAFIENPVRASPRLRRAPASVSLVIGLVLIASVLAASVGLRTVHAVHYTAQPPPALSGSALLHQATSAQVEAAVAAGAALHSAPSNLDPPAAAVKQYGGLTAAEDRCDSGYDVTAAPACYLGDTSASTTMVLWGDSHAAMWSPAFAAIARADHVRLAVFAKYGCAPLLGVEPWHPTEDKPYATCPSYQTSALAAIQRLRPTTIVLTGAFRGWAYAHNGKRVAGGTYSATNQWFPTSATNAVWDAALTRTLSALRPLGARVIVLGDSAYPLQDGAVCLAKNAGDLPKCATKRSDAVFAAHNDAEAATARGGGATYVPVDQWFCTSTTCPAVVAGRAVYLDDYHVTQQFSLYLARALGTATGLLGPGAQTTARAPAHDAGTRLREAKHPPRKRVRPRTGRPRGAASHRAGSGRHRHRRRAGGHR